MKNHAFTLIELLVVVLIIGILAAIALPQYQKSVMCTRYASLKSLARSIANAEEVYYLANDKYSVDFDELDVDMPGNTIDCDFSTEDEAEIEAGRKKYRCYDWGKCYISNGDKYSEVNCSNSLIKMGYKIRFIHSVANPGKQLCVAYGSADANSLGAQVCKAETVRTTPSNTNAGENPYTSYWY